MKVVIFLCSVFLLLEAGVQGLYIIDLMDRDFEYFYFFKNIIWFSVSLLSSIFFFMLWNKQRK